MFTKQIQDIYAKWKNKRTSNLKRWNTEEYQALIQETDFLPEQASISQRFWHIKHNTTDLPYCKHCGVSTVKWHASKGGYVDYCSIKCASSSDKRKQKYTTTIQARYGETHYSHTQEFKEKFSCTQKAFSIQKKRQINNKRSQTVLLRYGVQHIGQSSQIKQQIKETNLEKYGHTNYLASEEGQDKIKQRCQEYYGVDYPTQIHIADAFNHISQYMWLYNQHVNLRKSATQIANELSIDLTTVTLYLQRLQITVRHISRHSYKCVQWLETIMQEKKCFIQHAHNNGEFRVPGTRLLVDGYCEETNTVYEFYGDIWHGNPALFKPTDRVHPFDPNITASELYEKTIKRENEIKKLGYSLHTIWENEWDNIVSSLHQY